MIPVDQPADEADGISQPQIIRIHKYGILSFCDPHAGVSGIGEAFVAVQYADQRRVLCLQILSDLRCVIAGAVLYDQDLRKALCTAKIFTAHQVIHYAFHAPLQKSGCIISRYTKSQ